MAFRTPPTPLTGEQCLSTTRCQFRLIDVRAMQLAQSIFAPDDFTIAAHFFVSLAINVAKSRGDPTFVSIPSFAKLAFVAADRKLSLIAAFSLETMLAGVPAGATTPVHEFDKKPAKPLSIMFGTSGSSGLRCALVTAIALTLPSLIKGRRTDVVSKVIWIWPATTSVIEGAPPLYGM